MGNFKIPKHFLSVSHSDTVSFLRGVGLTTHLQGVPRVRNREAILPPPCIIIFMFCTETTLPPACIFLPKLQPII